VNDAPVAVNDDATTNEDTPVTFNVTSNDTDVDGTINAGTVDLDPAAAGIQNTFTNTEGSWSVNATGDVTYTPTLNFNGTASITYRVNDNSGATSNSATITVTVTPVNDAPVAVNDNLTTDEDTPVTFNVISNDTDVDGIINAGTVDLDPASAGIQNTFINSAGSWSVNATGNVTYTPTLNFNGSASINYRVNDNSGATSNTATITVTVTSVNDAPVAMNDNATTNEDTPVTFNVTSNDTDVDGTINAGTVDLDPTTAGTQNTFSNAAGSWSVNATGNVTYTPTLNFSGTASITYRVNDSSGATSNTATITVTVTPVNDAPVAVNDDATTNEDTPVTFNVTSNDTDVDGTINAASVDLDPSTAGIQNTFTNASGSWSVNASGNVTYTPTLNFNGSASITYRVNDNGGATSNSAIITVTVTPVNDAPVAVNDNATTDEDTPVTFNVTSNDTDVDGTVNAASVDLDPSTAGIQNAFTNVTGSWSVNATGDVTYTPTLNFNGSASITYRVNDNSGATSNTATITVTLTPVNDAPVAVNDNATTNEDMPVTFNVTSNDTDVDGTINAGTVDLDPATAGTQNTVINSAGSWSVDASGDVTYTPTLNFNGSASITYRVNDNSGATSNTATITVTVTPVNDAPIAMNDNATTNEDTPVTFNVTSNDTDVDGTINAGTVDLDPATAGTQNTFTNGAGTWSVNDTGDVTYTPTLNFNGSTSITYRVNDNSGATSNSATITVTVNPVNDVPVAVDDNATTQEDVSVVIDVANNDYDDDGSIDPSTIDLDPDSPGRQQHVTNAAGTWTATPTGTVVFNPLLNYFGSATIRYVIADNEGGTSNPAVLIVEVTPVNDPVRITDDHLVVDEDGNVTANILANDVDVDGTINKASVDLDISTPGIQHMFTNGQGIWTVDNLGNLTFAPAANFNGNAAIQYAVADNTGDISEPGWVYVVVNDINDAPIVVADSFDGIEDVIMVFDPLANDIDIDGTLDPATLDLDPSTPGVQKIKTTSAGSWSADDSGIVTFIPVPNFNGTAVLSYTIADDDGDKSSVSAITITLSPVNDAPILFDSQITATQSFPVRGMVLSPADADPDGTALHINTTPITGPSHGSIVIDSDGSFEYVSEDNFVGTDQIVVEVCDSGLPLPSLCATTTITVTVVRNQKPVAAPKATTIVEDNSFSGSALGPLDRDPEGLPLTVETLPVTSPKHGTIVISANGDYQYTPDLNFNGTDRVVVRVCDTNPVPECTDIELAFTITAVNDQPIINGEAIQVVINSTFQINILDNDIDPDSTMLVVDIIPVVGAMHGTVLIDETGNLVYTPDRNYIGPDQIAFRICDTGNPLPALCATNTISIEVVDPNFGTVSIPEGFSPNGDGDNDAFVIGYLGTEKIQFEVYNRWGNLIYKDDDYQNDWHGTAMYGVSFGSEVPDGTYFYKVKVGTFQAVKSFTLQR
jgi:gliding motility-associated-like protein